MLSNNTLKIEGESDAVLFARNDLLQDVKVTIISHPYLDNTLNDLRAREIPWEVRSISLQHKAYTRYSLTRCIYYFIGI